MTTPHLTSDIVPEAFDTVDAPVAAAEGGYVNHPDDPGGETNHGITLGTARDAGFTKPMKEMTAAEAKAIRRRLYYEAPGFDQVAIVSLKVAAELYDTGVNMGPKVAGTYLQRALNVLCDAALPLNGNVGPLTMAALRGYIVKRGKAGEAVLLKALNCLQGAHYIEIAEARPASRSFIFGWLANRVSVGLCFMLATCSWQFQPPPSVPAPYVAPVHHGWETEDPVGARRT